MIFLIGLFVGFFFFFLLKAFLNISLHPTQINGQSLISIFMHLVGRQGSSWSKSYPV